MASQATPLDTSRRPGYTSSKKIYSVLLISGDTPVDKARLKGVAVTHAGDSLNASPITAVGLRLSDEAVRMAVGYQLGSTTCKPHTCICGTAVDARGLHSHSCSSPMHIPTRS